MSSSKSDNAPVMPFPAYWIHAGSLLAWMPLIVHREKFLQFFFFMDEWDLINKLYEMGYKDWVFGFFAENFVPFFKLIWSSLLFVGNGNYHVLLLAGFVVHWSVVWLFGYVLRSAGFSLFSTLFCQSVLALNYTHIEVLSWSSQFCTLMALVALLVVMVPIIRNYRSSRRTSWVGGAMIFFVSALGALSFARGVLTGAAVLGGCIILFLLRDRNVGHLWKPALFAFVPCFLVLSFVAVWSYAHSANFADSGSRIEFIASHFYFNLALNPWFQQIRGLQISTSLAAVLIQLNVLVVFFGVRWATPHQRLLLYVLGLFFLGNSVLLALGRNHLHIAHVAGWRYQYWVILCFAPFVALILDRMIRVIKIRTVRVVCFSLVLVLSAHWVFKPWGTFLPTWAESRGSETRALLDGGDVDPAAHTISRFDQVINERALELRDTYNLH